MLTKIEEFLFGENLVHLIVLLEKRENYWLLSISPINDLNTIKSFIFHGAKEVYEELILDENEVLEYPFDIIGFDCFHHRDNIWRFCLNASEIEWGFYSEWPVRA